MESKLTLRLDKNIIEQIKVYALQQQCSVSDLTERLYKTVLVKTSTKDSGKFKTPFAQKYKGILADKVVDVDDARFEALSDKYLR